MRKRCIVQECVNRVDAHEPLCDQCYMILCSGIVKKTKSFLRCIPWMRNKLIKIKELTVAPNNTPNEKLDSIVSEMADVEGDE